MKLFFCISLRCFTTGKYGSNEQGNTAFCPEESCGCNAKVEPVMQQASVNDQVLTLMTGK